MKRVQGGPVHTHKSEEETKNNSSASSSQTIPSEQTTTTVNLNAATANENEDKTEDEDSEPGELIWKEGNILDAPEEHIFQQLNCVQRVPAKGVASYIFFNEPESDVYKQRNTQNRAHDQPGTITIHGGRIINGYGQIMPGYPTDSTDQHEGSTKWITTMKKRWPNVTQKMILADTKHNRVEWFESCCDKVKKVHGKKGEDEKHSIAIPERIGCERGHGDKQTYQTILKDLAKSRPKWKIVIYIFKPNIFIETKFTKVKGGTLSKEDHKTYIWILQQYELIEIKQQRNDFNTNKVNRGTKTQNKFMNKTINVLNMWTEWCPSYYQPWVLLENLSKKTNLYIGRDNSNIGQRQSKWANPFPVKEKGRQEALAWYKEWIIVKIIQHPEHYNLNELTGMNLCCSCKPHDCHGDILQILHKVWQQRMKEKTFVSMSNVVEETLQSLHKPTKRTPSELYETNYGMQNKSSGVQDKKECLDFQKGKCMRGYNCKFEHVDNSAGEIWKQMQTSSSSSGGSTSGGMRRRTNEYNKQRRHAIYSRIRENGRKRSKTN